MLTNAAPGLSPSPQSLTLHLFRCSVCGKVWFDPGADHPSMTFSHCNLAALFVGSYRVLVDPNNRIELPPRLQSHNEEKK